MKKHNNNDDVISKYLSQHDELTEEIKKLGRKGGFCEEPEDFEHWNMVPDEGEDDRYTSGRIKSNNAEAVRLCRKRERLEKKIRKLKKETAMALGESY